MARSVPFEAPCAGGLVLNSNKFSLLKAPGVATRLRNFEVSVSGGYRRINGYASFGGEYSAMPAGTSPILGVQPYALGLVVVADDAVYYTEDGISYIQVNKNTGSGGSTLSELSTDIILPRVDQEKAQFVVMRGTVDNPLNPYGTLTIVSGDVPIANFYIDDSGVDRLFFYQHLDVHSHGAPAGATLATLHAQHLCVVDNYYAPNTVYYTANSSDNSFTGTGSGSVTLPDHIVGIRGFRDDLYIFCRNSIHRLVEINTPGQTQVIPVTTNLGCVDGFTIQEVGGDLLYLAPDGIRTIAGTERIGDIELSSVSKQIQPLINNIVSSADDYVFSSVVIRKKNQYRLYYRSEGGIAKGVIGTFVANQSGVGFEWSEIDGIDVYSIAASPTSDDGVIYHGDGEGSVYIHDVGSSFDGDPIFAEYQTPSVDMGDLGMRKTLHYANVSITNEGQVSVFCQPIFDFSSSRTVQPAPFLIASELAPAIFGSFAFGGASFGSVEDPLTRRSAQGSGHSVALKFYSEDTNPPYTINGYHLEVMPSGRR